MHLTIALILKAGMGQKHTGMRSLVLLTAALLLSGCATSGNFTLTPTDRDTIFVSAASMIDHPNQLLAVEVGSSGPAADAAFIALSKSSGPSSLARQVAGLLADAGEKPSSILLFGINSRKVRQVAGDAFSLTRDRNLSKLTFLFHGNACDFEQLKEEAEFTGKLLHVSEGSRPR